MGKRIVLSGVTRGLGRALVPIFNTTKHTIIGCGRSAGAIDELAKKYPAPNQFATVDVRDWAAVDAWARQVIASVGPPELLIANAAFMHETAPLWEIPPADFDNVIDTNIKGVANLIRAFAPAMIARKAGVIVTLSSGWGRTTSPEVSAYCASKFAVEAMTLALAQELPPSMAAIPLNPGVIYTEMLRKCWGEKATTFQKADAWAKRAGPFLLNLSARENGKSLSVPA